MNAKILVAGAAALAGIFLIKTDAWQSTGNGSDTIKPPDSPSDPTGRESNARCNRLGANIIAASWGVNPRALWAIFGVESDFGNNVAERPNDGRGPMQVTKTAEALLRARYYSKLGNKDVYDCGGAFEFACAHLKYTSELLNVPMDDPRNIVAYNSGANSTRVRSITSALQDWYFLRYHSIYKRI